MHLRAKGARNEAIIRHQAATVCAQACNTTL